MKKRYARILAATLSAAMVFTSAPTAAFATEFDVVDEVVDVEGATAKEIVDAFPSVVVENGLPSLYYMNSGALTEEGGGKSLGSITIKVGGVNKSCALTYALPDARTLDQYNYGEEVAIKLIANVNAVTTVNADFFNAFSEADGFKFNANGAGTTDDTIERTVKVNVVLDGATYDPTLGAANIANDIFAAGTDGTDAVTPTKVLYTMGADKIADTRTAANAANDYFDVANLARKWKYVSIVPELKTKKVGDKVEKAAKFECLTTIDAAEYDTEKLVADLNKDDNALNAWGSQKVTYSYVGGKLYADVDVTVSGKATKKADDIVWPTIPALTYGDKIADVKFAEACDGTFTIMDVVNAAGTTKVSTGSIAAAGELYAVVKYALKDAVNYDIDTSDSGDGAVKYSAAGGAHFEKKIKVNVAKKALSTDAEKIALIKKEFEFGKKYADATATANLQLAEGVKVSIDQTRFADAEMMPVGTFNVEFKLDLIDEENTSFADGTTATKIIKVPVTVKPAKIRAIITTGNSNNYGAAFEVPQISNVKVDASPLRLNAWLSDETPVTPTNAIAALQILNGKVDLEYTWYKIDAAGTKTKVKQSTADNYYEVDIADTATNTYVCEINAVLKNTVIGDERKAYVSAIGTGLFTTQNTTITSAAKVLDVGLSATSEAYGAITATITVNDDTDSNTLTGLNEDSAKAYVVAADGTKTDATDVAMSLSGADYTITANVPTSLKPGKYVVVVEAKTTANKELKGSAAYVVEKGVLDPKGEAYSLDYSAIKATLEKKEYTYGVKSSELVLSNATNKFGSFVLSDKNPEYLPVGNNVSVAVKFVPNAESLALYDEFKTGSVSTVDIDKIPETAITGIVVKKATLAVTADKVVVKVGDKLPDATATIKGFVAGDTADKFAIKAVAEYSKTVDTSVAGEYKNCVTAKLVTKLGAPYAAGSALDMKYTLTYVDADIVVEGAEEEVKPSTAPTVAPTVAPTKAPAVKPAKSTYPVKAGKTVALKVKNAPKGAKVTWSVDKKAKKALKVSKKGKVTVKKGAKKGTYKVYAKVNGKKVTFKVKVK